MRKGLVSLFHHCIPSIWLMLSNRSSNIYWLLNSLSSDLTLNSFIDLHWESTHKQQIRSQRGRKCLSVWWEISRCMCRINSWVFPPRNEGSSINPASIPLKQNYSYCLLIHHIMQPLGDGWVKTEIKYGQFLQNDSCKWFLTGSSTGTQSKVFQTSDMLLTKM